MRVVGLFSRRGYNIDSLSVSVTEDPEISRITIVVSSEVHFLDQIILQIEKLVDVIRVFEMPSDSSLQRELALVKVSATDENRRSVIELSEIFKGKVVDVSPKTLTVQIVGGMERIREFLKLMRGYGVCEMVCTGMTAMERGEQTLAEMAYAEY